jgi:hypothetical protein
MSRVEDGSYSRGAFCCVQSVRIMKIVTRNLAPGFTEESFESIPPLNAGLRLDGLVKQSDEEERFIFR